MAKIKLTETQTNGIIQKMLEQVGCFVWRSNTGGFMSGGHYRRYGLVGSSDIIGIAPDGKFIAVENKCNGEPLSEKQKAFQNEIESRGGYSFVIRSIEEIDKLQHTLCGLLVDGLLR